MAVARRSMHGEWSSRWAFVLAAAGSAIGLGNIWKFPYLTGEHGGDAFVRIYLGSVAGRITNGSRGSTSSKRSIFSPRMSCCRSAACWSRCSPRGWCAVNRARRSQGSRTTGYSLWRGVTRYVAPIALLAVLLHVSGVWRLLAG